jgi:hypothetical protein
MPLQDSDIFLVTKPDGSDCRHIRADNLFSGIADDWCVLVNEGEDSKRCLVSELVDKASDDRYMLVNANESPPIINTTSIGPIVNVGTTTGVDYAPYVKLIDLNTGADVTNHSFQFSEGTPNDVFNGNEAANSKYYRGMRYTNADVVNAKFVFTPPQPITVNGLIEVKGGFCGDSRDGVLKINGQVVVEINAFDLEPEWASAEYTGEIHTIEYHQKRYPGSPDGVDIAPDGKNITAFFSITAFKIDGEYLISNQPGVTYLDFNPGTDFTDFSYNNEIKECDASENLQDAVGKIGEIKESQNRIVLLTNQPNWDVGNYACKQTITFDESNPIYKSYKVKSSSVVSAYAPSLEVPITSTFTYNKSAVFAGIAATFDETFSSIQPTTLDPTLPTNDKTIRFTVPVAVPSGSTLIVTVGGRTESTVEGAFSMSDSQGNTYTSVIQGSQTNLLTFPSIFMADINTSLSTSDTITLSTTNTVRTDMYMFGCIYVIDSQGVSVVDTDDFRTIDNSSNKQTVDITASGLTVAMTTTGLGGSRTSGSNPDFTELVIFTEHQRSNTAWAWYLVGTDLGNGNPFTFDISEEPEEYTDLSSYLEDTDSDPSPQPYGIAIV